MADSPLKPVSRTTGDPRALDYAPPLTLSERVRGWFPSGEQFVNVLKTLVWVAPLTLLIWVYAEREQTVTVDGVTFPVDVRTVDPDRLVTLRSPADKNIIVELSGPRAMVDRARELLQPKPDGPPVLIYVDPQLKPVGQELLTVAQINNHPAFRNNGITVKSAQPPYLYVDIDTYVEREVPVKAPPDVASLLVESTTRFAPDTVRLRAPKHLVDAADESKTPLVVYADLGKREELRTRTGVQKLEGVPVYWSRRENVTLSPVTVTATLDIKQRDVEWTIPSVTIFKESPAGFEDTNRVEYEAQIKNVAVTGPPEAIEKMRKEGGYKATFEVSAFDKANEPLKKWLRFELPQGVQLTKEAKARTEWTVTIKPIER